MMLLPVASYPHGVSLGKAYFSTPVLFCLFAGAMYILWAGIYALGRTRWLRDLRQMPLDVKAMAYVAMVAGGVLLLFLIVVLLAATAIAGLVMLALRALFSHH